MFLLCSFFCFLVHDGPTGPWQDLAVCQQAESAFSLGSTSWRPHSLRQLAEISAGRDRSPCTDPWKVMPPALAPHKVVLLALFHHLRSPEKEVDLSLR